MPQFNDLTLIGTKTTINTKGIVRPIFRPREEPQFYDPKKEVRIPTLIVQIETKDIDLTKLRE